MNNINLNERIIFALDVPTPEEAKQLVRKLDGDIKFFKVGLELFLAGWWDIVDFIIDRGNKVMLDLKFFDIPETVHLAVQQVKDRGVSFTTIHGNDAIIRAAVSDRGNVKVLAVTVLTSFDESDMRQMGLTGSVEDLVLIRAKKALELGCDGVVSSALEAKPLRNDLGDNFLIVTPGIRPESSVPGEDDQKRIATARNAIISGANHVVIGRPIRTAADPISTIKKLQDEIAQGLADR
ncbi:orotidine-5'-phosphate decarboxylase [Methyloglobulus sp.]|uniref:orotidine-5'-phosphate decarboxylase n=1 Tax=Methyloglobulus sp. TaxID=2518622 RepID=UPI0017E1D68E|nr:orotidine-5'-phosphate decarboxylase [Methyloglobulus sp.]